MKRLPFALLTAVLISGAGCAAENQTAAAPPALIKPASVKSDTAVVERGDIQVMDQYKAFVRTESDGLYFGDTNLVFKEFFVISGQSVKKGDLLALLDTELIEDDIEEQEEKITNTIRENEFANNSSTIAIDKVRAEYVKLVRESGLDEESVYKAESKRKEIAVAELALKQQKDRQALTVLQEEKKLAELTETLPTAELRAPYDGEICLIKEKLPGDSITPYDPIIYITDKKNMFLEVVTENSTITNKAAVKGFHNGKEYALERITISRQEALYYSTLRVNQPVRYEILAEPKDIPPLGSFMTVMVYTNQAEDVLRIPVNALHTDTELGPYVYLIKDGVKVQTYISENLRNDCYAEVISGLKEGDEVYVKP